MNNEYYVVTTTYCWDRIVNKQEYVFRTKEAAQRFYDRKKKEFERSYEMSVDPIEIRHFED